jgi:hypothetical protein
MIDFDFGWLVVFAIIGIFASASALVLGLPWLVHLLWVHLRWVS